MSSRFRSVVLTSAVALAVAACGGDTTSDPTASPGTTSAESPTTTGGTDTTSAGGGDEGMATVTVGGTTFELSVADDIAVPGSGVSFPTRCEPDFFSAGRFWVIAVAVSEDGVLQEPQVSLTFDLPHDPNAGGDPAEFEVRDDSGPFRYRIATDDSVVFQAGEFTGDLGSWTVEGNRIHGEIAVYEYDHVREYSTATFEVTCPSG